MTVLGSTTDPSALGRCPDGHRLALFLHLQLEAAERNVVRAHVDGCAACQATLDRLSGSGLDWCQTPVDLAPTAPDRVSVMVDKLCRVLEIEPPAKGPQALPIQFEPTSDGQALGRLNRFLIVREIARGASATVFAAIDSNDQTTVAIKYIRSTDPSVLRRVEREARALSEVQHPHIISILAVESSPDGRLYLVMPLAAGRPLSELIQDKQSLSQEQAVAIVLQVAQGLQAMHERGLIHRDIKPANVMVDERGNACVTDFGLVAYVEEESSLTATDVVIGTPAYMSPEQAQNSLDLDARSDLYSLGATLYECLAGVRPFRGPWHQILQQLQTTDPVTLRTMNPQISPGLEAICMQAMHKRPEQRYRTVAAMIEDLQAWQTGRPLRARRPSLWAPLRKSLTRNIRLTTAIVAVAITLILGAAAAWYYSIQAATQAQLAQSRFDASLQTISLLAELTTQTLSGDPGLAAVRRQVQMMADKAFEPLLQQRPTDPEQLLRYLQAMDHLGTIKHTVVGPQEAFKFRQQLIADHRAALTAQSLPADLRRLWASLHHRLAVGHVELRDYDAASLALDEARQHLDQASPDDHLLLASVEHSRGTVAYWKNNDIVTAADHFRQAVAWADSYLIHRPAERLAQATRGNTLGWLANCELTLGNAELAEQMLRELWQDYRQLAQATPDSYQHRLDQNRAALSLLHLLITRQKTTEAVTWSRELESEFATFVAANPTLMEPAALQIGFGCEVVGAELALGEFAAATSRAETMLTLARDLDQRFPQATRAWQQLGYAKQMWVTCLLNRGDDEPLTKFLADWLETVDRELAQNLNQGFNQQLRLGLRFTLARVFDRTGQAESAHQIWEQILADAPDGQRPGLQWFSQIADAREMLRDRAPLALSLDQGFNTAVESALQYLILSPDHPDLAFLRAEHHALAWHYLQQLPATQSIADSDATSQSERPQSAMTAEASRPATNAELAAKHWELAQRYLQQAQQATYFKQGQRTAHFRRDPLFQHPEWQRCVTD